LHDTNAPIKIIKGKLLTNKNAAKGFQESVGASRKKMDINCNNGVGTNGDKA
jgi:hypothetical protein